MNQTINLSQIKSISELPKNYSQLSQDALNQEIIFLKRNKPYVVMLGFEQWQKLASLKKREEEKKALTAIEKGEKEHQQGKTQTLHSFSDLI